MTFIDAFLNVLAIIGIIVAGGFLVFFLGDLLLSILEPRRKEKDSEEVEEVVAEEPTLEKQQAFTLEEEPTVSEEKFVMDDESVAVDYDAAQRERESLGIVDQQQEDVFEEDINAIFNDDEDFNFNDNFDFDKLFDEEEKVEETSSEKIAESDILPILPATVAAAVAGSNPEYEEQLKKEIESLKNELEEQKSLYESLKEQSKNNEEKWEIEKADLEKLYKDAEENMEEKPLASLSLEEYENRLEVLRARLKVNEKELKANKKEFLPLKRVRKNLDKDKEKLRRREALVAKQKVMLYGVNNITDIDQEKAQKLAEDLDLLDGLKVSVRHCEEVMESNKDRYPILETANRILVTQNREIKEDIEECENAIKALKNGNNTDETAVAVAQTEPTPVAKEEANAEELIANANEAINAEEKQEVLVAVENAEEKPKRKRGRPRKETVAPVVAEEPKFETNIENVTMEDVFAPFENHEFDYDAEEPSFEDLFAIEQEEKDKKDDDLF